MVRCDSFELAADILVWAEPLVRDRLALFWGAAARDSVAARALADLHWRSWRSALSNFPHATKASRRELAQLLRGASLAADTIAQADEVVIDEIAEVIFVRFRRSPLLAKDYTKAPVLIAAGHLQPSESAKAA